MTRGADVQSNEKRTLSFIKAAADGALDLLYPMDCRLCGRKGVGSSVLCMVCWEKIPLWHGAKCGSCGAPSAVDLDSCGYCPQSKGANESLGKIRSAGHYSGVLRSALLAMKYERKPHMAPYFAELIVRVEPPLYDWGAYEEVVYAPGHRVRRLERGFDQAALLARRLAQLTGLPVGSGWLRRVKRTRILARVGDFEARRSELEGVFKAKLPAKARGRRLLLADDIVTTGATTGEIAHTLREAGSGPVDVVSAARAYHPAPFDHEESALFDGAGNWI